MPLLHNSSLVAKQFLATSQMMNLWLPYAQLFQIVFHQKNFGFCLPEQLKLFKY